jgi:hypothetical protein
MAHYNTSPAHFRPSRDPEEMKRRYQAWWRGRTGESGEWELHAEYREELTTGWRPKPTGHLLIAMVPDGAWYETHHEWDRFAFDVLVDDGAGSFTQESRTGKWLRKYTRRADGHLCDLGQRFLDVSAHPLAQEYRRKIQHNFLSWQQSIGYSWGAARIQMTLRQMAGPDEPIAAHVPENQTTS